MILKPSDLAGKPIHLTGSLLGIHAIMRPDTDRILAVILTSDFQQYTLFIRQESDSIVELLIEESPKDPPAQHPLTVRKSVLQR